MTHLIKPAKFFCHKDDNLPKSDGISHSNTAYVNIFIAYVLGITQWSIFSWQCFTVYEDFEGLLQEQVTIDSYIEWLDKIIDESIVQVGEEY